MYTSLVVSTLLIVQLAGVSATDEAYPVEEFSLSPQVAEVLQRSGFPQRYRISFHVNPFFLNGDFDGDGALDTEVLVKAVDSGKAGIAIVHGKSTSATVLGAGDRFGETNLTDSDDFGWLDAWYVYPKGSVGQGVEEGPPPELRGDAILAMKTEVASGLIYWTGVKYDWYQQGD